ncbi:MAG: dimethylamine monooxygenase subunit DmmA family protein [Candidatus Limnocylindria bacterium]
MLVEGIKSRPVYAPLTLRPGGPHLVVADGEGALAVLDLAAALDPTTRAAVRAWYVPGGSAGTGHEERLAAAGLGSCVVAPTKAAAVAGLREALAAARMGAQVYAAGTEDLIGQVVQAALDAGVELGAIGAEHRGSLARRVQCVHCKAITEHVTTQPVACSGCGLMLLVRDHFSRRIGAFQGVCIDAEAPGTAPPPEPVFA